MKTTLFNIQTDYAALMDEIEQAEGVLSEEMEQRLEINKDQLQTKSIAYLEVIRQREAFISTVDEEIKRLEGLKKVNGNLVSRLKNNLLNAVKSFGDFSVGTVTFSSRKSSSVIVEDVNGLPKDFKKIKVTESADKKAIKEAIKGGAEVKGAYIQENKSLAIK